MQTESNKTPAFDYSKAVVISSTDHAEGVEEEYEFITDILTMQGAGGYRLVSQRLHKHEGRWFDVVSVQPDLPAGAEAKTFVFDISAFFGKHLQA